MNTNPGRYSIIWRNWCVLCLVLIFTTGCEGDNQSTVASSLPIPGDWEGAAWVERTVGGVPFGEITLLAGDHFLIDVKSTANLLFEFEPIPGKWHRVSGEIRLVKSARGIYTHTLLMLGFMDNPVGYGNRSGSSLRVWDYGGVWQEFSFIAYAGPGVALGRFQLLPSAGSMEIRGLRIEERGESFISMANDLQKVISKNYFGTNVKKRIAHSVPDTLLAMAGTATNRNTFAEVLRMQLMAMDDDDIVWGQESLNDLGLTAEPITRSNLQLNKLKSESLRSVRSVRSGEAKVTSWLEGDVAYIEPIGGLVLGGIREGQYLDSKSLEGAKAVILDLRRCKETGWLALTERGRYQAVRALVSACMVDSVRWARRVPKRMEARPWLYLSPPQDRIEIPVLVLIGPQTNGAGAMAAEVFKRTGTAVLVGEETDKMPACRMRHFIPWNSRSGGRRCILYPAGVWESGDGSKLTGRRVTPNIKWPVDDTDSLISKCRDILKL